MTPRMLQSEFYNSRYDLFGRTHWVRIVSRLKFAANAPQIVLSTRINKVSHICTLATYKTLKHQNEQKTSENNKTNGLTNKGQICNIWHSSHSFTHVDEMNECLAPESNNTQARLPYKGIVPMMTLTMFPLVATFSGVRE